MNKGLDIRKFLKRFDSIYSYLYDNNGSIDDYEQVVASFDMFLRDHAEFVGQFAAYRGDFISSDREAAAFMLALSDMF